MASKLVGPAAPKTQRSVNVTPKTTGYDGDITETLRKRRRKQLDFEM
jgi:hypothetical protein